MLKISWACWACTKLIDGAGGMYPNIIGFRVAKLGQTGGAGRALWLGQARGPIAVAGSWARGHVKPGP